MLVMLALLSGTVVAATFVPPASNRVVIDFNADWLYIQGDVSGAQAQNFADTGWTSVGLPHTTKLVSPEDPYAYIGVSWDRKHFTVGSSYQGRKIFIQFGTAMQTANVYVNGNLVLQHNGGYTPLLCGHCHECRRAKRQQRASQRYATATTAAGACRPLRHSRQQSSWIDLEHLRHGYRV